MTGWTKLFSSIVTSSIWVEDDATLRVWIAMLAAADHEGVVEGAVPGFANLSRVSVEQMETALSKLTAPDPYSRTPDNEGRRLEAIEGGWKILNHGLYRERPQEREGSKAPAMRRYRARQRAEGGNALPEKVTEGNALPRREKREERGHSTEEEKNVRTHGKNPKLPDRESEFAVWWDAEHRELAASPAFWSVAAETYDWLDPSVIRGTWDRLSLYLRERPKALEAREKKGDLCAWVQAKIRQDAVQAKNRTGSGQGQSQSQGHGRGGRAPSDVAIEAQVGQQDAEEWARESRRRQAACGLDHSLPENQVTGGRARWCREQCGWVEPIRRKA